MTFEQWYSERYAEWWRNQKSELSEAWEKLAAAGVSNDLIAETFDTVADAIAAQYGD